MTGPCFDDIADVMELQDGELRGRVAFITGGSRGIGRATALALGRAGADIAIGFRDNREAADEVARQLAASGVSGVPVQLDLRDLDQLSAAFAAVEQRFGGLDMFIASAAATAFKPLLEVRPHHVDQTFAITVKSFLFGVQHAARLMERRGGGQVVAVSGYDCVRTLPRHGVLGAAKAAMETLARQFAFELGPRHIRVNCVNFVYVQTDSSQFYLGDRYADFGREIEALTPLRGRATPEDVANAIRFLCSPRARFISGQTIMIDGGVLLTPPAPHQHPEG